MGSDLVVAVMNPKSLALLREVNAATIGTLDALLFELNHSAHSNLECWVTEELRNLKQKIQIALAKARELDQQERRAA